MRTRPLKLQRGRLQSIQLLQGPDRTSNRSCLGNRHRHSLSPRAPITWGIRLLSGHSPTGSRQSSPTDGAARDAPGACLRYFEIPARNRSHPDRGAVLSHDLGQGLPPSHSRTPGSPAWALFQSRLTNAVHLEARPRRDSPTPFRGPHRTAGIAPEMLTTDDGRLQSAAALHCATYACVAARYSPESFVSIS